MDNFVLRVLMASHNRVAMTSSILKQLSAIDAQRLFDIEVFVVDDGSSDGTYQMLSTHSIVKHVHEGDGSLFWAKAMAKAEEVAISWPQEPGKKYFFLWLNDDVTLIPNKMVEAVEFCRKDSQAIFVGAMRTPTGEHSYGGFSRAGIHPLRVKHVHPNGHLQTVETFNGNFLLYSLEVAQKLGKIDGRFSHALADVDYGFRATDAKIPIFQLPEYVGICDLNQEPQFLSTIAAWRHFTSTKGGGEFKSLVLILKKRTSAWPLFVLITYCLWWARRIAPKSRFSS